MLRFASRLLSSSSYARFPSITFYNVRVVSFPFIPFLGLCHVRCIIIIVVSVIICINSVDMLALGDWNCVFALLLNSAPFG